MTRSANRRLCSHLLLVFTSIPEPALPRLRRCVGPRSLAHRGLMRGRKVPRRAPVQLELHARPSHWAREL